jgi:hypothetical protein
MSNDDHTIQDLNDTGRSCCKIGRKRFVGALYLQVVGHFLLRVKTNPLWIFSPHFISNISDDRLY